MGALTLKPLAYKARSWELNNIEITNFLDSYCGQIAIQKRGNEILRVLPSRKDNYYWITDKVRFFFESLKKQRVTYPLLYINNKYVKINWQNSIILFKFIKCFNNIISNINIIANELKIKNFKVYKELYIKYNKEEGDLLSHYLINEFLQKRNVIKYEFVNYKGNINNNFYPENFLKKIKKNKYNILNNINIINDYPRIWSIIKNTKIIVIGNKKNIKLQTYTINNTNEEINKIEKAKSVLGFFKNDMCIFTENEIKNNKHAQIILNKNINILNKKWISNQNNNCKTRKDVVVWSFFKNPVEKALGINFNFLTHGMEEKMEGSQIIFPVTTFIEENSLSLNPYGEIEKSIPVNVRATNARTLAQIIFLIKNLFNNEDTKNSKIDFKFLKDILLLKYGQKANEYIEKKDYIIKPKIQEKK